MVKITNGVNVFEVTTGAFESIFSHQGYHIMNEKKPEKATAEAKVDNVENEKLDEDNAFIALVEEKPISQWNKTEVKRYAELKGIDLVGTKNVNEAKERIKAAIDCGEE